MEIHTASWNNPATARYRKNFATNTIATKIGNGVRAKPAIAVSGSPIIGAQDSNNDHTPHLAYQAVY